MLIVFGLQGLVILDVCTFTLELIIVLAWRVGHFDVTIMDFRDILDYVDDL